MATKKPTSTALVPWEKEMAEAAKKQAQAEKPVSGMASISTRGGVLSVDGDVVKGNELRLVVVGAVHENAFYPGRFDPDSPTAPVCYAFANEDADDPEATLAPHPESEDPQASSCADCPNNAMGSADTGRGKACKNIRRLVVVTEDALENPEALKSAEVRVLKVPVTSVKNWAQYVRNVLTEDLNKPYFAVVTTVSCAPDPKTQYKVQFELAEAINFNAALWGAMKDKRAAVSKLLAQPYPKNSELEERRASKAPARGGKFTGRAQPMKPVGRVAQKAVAKKAGR